MCSWPITEFVAQIEVRSYSRHLRVILDNLAVTFPGALRQNVSDCMGSAPGQWNVLVRALSRKEILGGFRTPGVQERSCSRCSSFNCPSQWKEEMTLFNIPVDQALHKNSSIVIFGRSGELQRLLFFPSRA